MGQINTLLRRLVGEEGEDIGLRSGSADGKSKEGSGEHEEDGEESAGGAAHRPGKRIKLELKEEPASPAHSHSMYQSADESDPDPDILEIMVLS